MTVAFVALSAALAGTSIALPGRNRVDGGDIKKNAVRSSDIRNNQVFTQDIRNGTIRDRDIANNAITGGKINEATLGSVPTAANATNATNAVNATNATNAVNAVNAVTAGKAGDLAGDKFLFRVAPGTGATQILSHGGFTLTAACSAGGNLSVIAASTVQDSFFQTYSQSAGVTTDLTNSDGNTAFGTGDEEDIVADNQEFQLGHTSWTAPAGPTVSIQWLADEDQPAAENNCHFSGNAQLG